LALLFLRMLARCAEEKEEAMTVREMIATKLRELGATGLINNKFNPVTPCMCDGTRGCLFPTCVAVIDGPVVNSRKTWVPMPDAHAPDCAENARHEGTKEGIEWMACWLLDHKEGETITEELLRQWACEALNARHDCSCRKGKG
jgi:hypothetical protein